MIADDNLNPLRHFGTLFLEEQLKQIESFKAIDEVLGDFNQLSLEFLEIFNEKNRLVQTNITNRDEDTKDSDLQQSKEMVLQTRQRKEIEKKFEKISKKLKFQQTKLQLLFLSAATHMVYLLHL